MMQQNYAKFESRIMDNNQFTENIPSFDSVGGLGLMGDSLFRFLGDIMDFVMFFFQIGMVMISLFLCVYIVISLFTRGGEKTLGELKQLSSWSLGGIQRLFSFVWQKSVSMFSYFYKRKKLSVLLIIIGVFVVFGSSVVDGNSRFLKLSKIASGYVGVDLKNNKILSPGYHLYSPIKTTYFLSPTNNFDFEIVEVTANTKEDLGVTLDYRVGFRLKDDKRLDFYNTYGPKNIRLVSSDVVMPRLLEVIKGIIRDYGFKEISSRHSEIKKITLQEANEVLLPIGIELQDITILDIRLPESYLKSKEDLLKSENELKLAEAKLQAQKKESERKVLEAENNKKIKIIEAQGVAEYNTIVSSENITKNAIEMKKLEIQRLKIEKWDGKMPTHLQGELDF